MVLTVPYVNCLLLKSLHVVGPRGAPFVGWGGERVGGAFLG